MWKIIDANLVGELEQFGKIISSRSGKEEPTLRLSTFMNTIVILGLNIILHLNPFLRQ